jgi:hypothetical protein
VEKYFKKGLCLPSQNLRYSIRAVIYHLYKANLLVRLCESLLLFRDYSFCSSCLLSTAEMTDRKLRFVIGFYHLYQRTPGVSPGVNA